MAVLCDQREVTYGELRSETVQAAQILQALGIKAGERVAILLHDSPEFIATFLAVQSVGAIAVAINMALRPAEQRAIIDDCTARIAIIEASHCNTMLTDDGNTLRSVNDIVVVCRERDPRLRLPRRPRSDLRRAAAGAGCCVSYSSLADTPAVILYTSGSTGEPKGHPYPVNIFYITDLCKQVLDFRPGTGFFIFATGVCLRLGNV